jgi:hypothetical protein
MEQTILSRLGVKNDDNQQLKILRIFNRLFLLKLGLAIDDSLTDKQRQEFSQLDINSLDDIINWYYANVSDGQETYNQVFDHTIDEVKNQILRNNNPEFLNESA